MKMKGGKVGYMVFFMVFKLKITWFLLGIKDKVWIKLFDKLEIPQRNSNKDKDVILFVIKSNKFDLFFNQF